MNGDGEETENRSFAVIFSPDRSTFVSIDAVEFMNKVGERALVREPPKTHMDWYPVHYPVPGRRISKKNFAGYMRPGLLEVFPVAYKRLFHSSPYNSIEGLRLPRAPVNADTLICPETEKRMLEKEGDLAVLLKDSPNSLPEEAREGFGHSLAVFVHYDVYSALSQRGAIRAGDEIPKGESYVWEAHVVTQERGKRTRDHGGFVIGQDLHDMFPKIMDAFAPF